MLKKWQLDPQSNWKKPNESALHVGIIYMKFWEKNLLLLTFKEGWRRQEQMKTRVQPNTESKRQMANPQIAKFPSKSV